MSVFERTFQFTENKLHLLIASNRAVPTAGRYTIYTEPNFLQWKLFGQKILLKTVFLTPG